MIWFSKKRLRFVIADADDGGTKTRQWSVHEMEVKVSVEPPCGTAQTFEPAEARKIAEAVIACCDAIEERQKK